MSSQSLPRVQAYMWWCGDDWCDCQAPVVERVEPSPTDRRFIRRITLWEGTFVSRGGGGWPDDPTTDDLKAELRQACERYEIPWDEERIDRGLWLEKPGAS